MAQPCITVTTQCDGSTNYCGPYVLSNGIYRLPFINETDITVTNDHFNHCPRGRIDMVADGGDVNGEYHIAAAADGWIRAIVDDNTQQCDCNVTYCENNYIWIEHLNSEWTKYTHMRQHSTRVRAKIAVGDKIKAGTYLGDEGDVGCASGDHLHFEVAVPFDLANPIRPQGGFVIGTNRMPRICGIPGQIFVRNTSYTAAACTGV